jgi:hypothetical protein
VVTLQPGRRERSKAASRARIIEGKETIYNYVRPKEDIIVAFLADVERQVQRRLTGRPDLSKAEG